MSNGCGCQTGVLKWFRPPYARTFFVPCCMHDDDYDRGGTAGDRREADRKLFARMVRLIAKGGYVWQPWRCVWMVFVAWLYYVSVRVFGRFYFNYIK